MVFNGLIKVLTRDIRDMIIYTFFKIFKFIVHEYTYRRIFI